MFLTTQKMLQQKWFHFFVIFQSGVQKEYSVLKNPLIHPLYQNLLPLLSGINKEEWEIIDIQNDR